MANKNQATIDFILTCPIIQNNPLFFNAIKAQDDSGEIVTVATDRALNSKFIDGSVLKRYAFTIIEFRSISDNPIPKNNISKHENVEEFDEIQQIIDWIEEQQNLRNYPNFGPDCIIDEMSTTTDIPDLNGIDTGVAPSLAKYSITIRIDYVDNSKTIFK